MQSPTTLQDLSYTYDNNGNVTQIVDASGTDTAKTTTYVYDDLNRLTSSTITSAANGDNTGRTYTYDAIGNIASSSDLGTYTYAGTGYANPHAVISIGSTTYTYDNNGNQTGDGTWTNTWDYNNQMSQSSKSGVTVTYGYDPSGQRVKVANGYTATYYPTNSYNTDGTNPQKHIFANGVVVATVKGTGASASVYTDDTDHLTGAHVVTNSAAGMVELEDYQPYGASRIDWQYSASFDEQRKFAGKEFDRDTGLSYMQARYQNPSIGRFISQDPAFVNLSRLSIQLQDPQSWNSYSYARNNPLAYIDPDGNMWTPWQSSGGLGAWMGNGAFLYNLYGFNVSSITSTARNIQKNGLTAANISALAADAASITAKTSGVILGGVGAGMAAGSLEAVPAAKLVRAATGAALNVAGTYLSSKVEGRRVSTLEYAYSAGTGAFSLGNTWLRAGLVAGGLNAAGQVAFRGSIDLPSAVITGLSAGAVQGLNITGLSSAPQAYKFMTEQVMIWTVETPAQVINSGIKKSLESKKTK